jgi:hypothetical protein
MEVEDDVTEYVAEPTAQRFHASNAIVKGIVGPLGSGKSVTVCWEIIRLAGLQKADKNGIRRSRCAAIRNTYGELKTTTIETWLHWFSDITTMRWAHPIKAMVECPGVDPVTQEEDGTTVKLEILFFSMDRPRDIKKLKSLDLTFIWLNECSELALATFEMAWARLWRYPPMKDGPGATNSVLLMDSNPPDDDHWYYRLAEEQDPVVLEALREQMEQYLGDDRPLMQFFRQPPALLRTPGKDGLMEWSPNPEAENVRNHKLGHGYWLQMVVGRPREWIKVFVEGNYGVVTDGMPVYPEYNDEIHCASYEIKPIEGIGLRFGWDFGLTPALVIAQMTPMGQLRVIDEICARAVGLRTFVTHVVMPHLHRHYSRWPIPDMLASSTGDPSGEGRGDVDESQSCIIELEDQGIPTVGAYTNELVPRREAVAGFMTRMLGDGQPGFLLSPKCKVLRKGFRGHYRLERIQVAGTERYRSEPVKDMFSHPQDALQYIALGLDMKQRDVRRRSLRGSRRSRAGLADATAGY